MYIIDEHGNKGYIDDNQLPESMKEWVFGHVQLINDHFELERCYVAQVNKRSFETKNAYDFIGERVYDHYPTKEELIWLLCEYQVLNNGYVSVQEAWRYHEVYD